jgi:hypothetical protein
MNWGASKQHTCHDNRVYTYVYIITYVKSFDTNVHAHCSCEHAHAHAPKVTKEPTLKAFQKRKENETIQLIAETAEQAITVCWLAQI